MELPNLFAVIGVLLWVGYELLLRHREDSGTADWRGGRADRGSTRLLLGSYAAAVLLNLAFSLAGVGQVSTGWRWIGVAVIVVGLALRAWGMRTLGRFCTRTLRTSEDQRVVQEGPYRLIRHPGYLGSLLVWVGYSLGLGNWIAMILVAALLLTAYGWRINTEEKLLVEVFGGEYTDYQRRTHRLVPYVF